MDLGDAPADAEFRAEVREWAQQAVPTLPWPEPVELAAKVPFWQQWQRLVFDAGYAGPSWPSEYGGGGLDARRRAILGEEFDRAGAPERLNIIGEDFAGLTIIDHGTDAQKRRFLEPILRGDEIWCQLFSEPEAGSDLASLRTVATRVDGGWSISGQKIWTSRAHIAAHAILLARTGGGARHKGITFFLLPMDTAGITVRPLRHMLGEAEFNEVFLDNVVIPDDLVVGEVDGGWPVAMATLGYERVAIATGRVNTMRAARDVVSAVAAASAPDGSPLAADSHIRQRVADLYGRTLVHQAIGQRVLSQAVEGSAPGPVTSIGKLFFCPLVEDVADFQRAISPLGGQLDPGDDDAADTAAWTRLAYQARGTAIAGGSTFIQRNIVAQRILGMPKP